MNWIEDIAKWVVFPALISIGIWIILFVITGFAEYIIDNKSKIDKIMNMVSLVGGIASIMVAVYVISVSIILIFKKIFL